MQTKRRAPRAAPAATAVPVPPTVALEGALDLNAAGRLHAALLERRGAALSVDASAVHHLGALCAQVLASAAATWAADGVPLRISDPSEAFSRGAKLLGLHDVLTPESERA